MPSASHENFIVRQFFLFQLVSVSVSLASLVTPTILWSSHATHSITHTQTHKATACILKMAARHVYETQRVAAATATAIASSCRYHCICVYKRWYHNVHRLHDNRILWTSFQSRTRRAVIKLCTVGGLTVFFRSSKRKLSNTHKKSINLNHRISKKKKKNWNRQSSSRRDLIKTCESHMKHKLVLIKYCNQVKTLKKIQFSV